MRDGLSAFVAGILDAAVSKDFLESFASFARRAALLGALNSLSQLTLKATVPGVPDFYQGTELWDLSLVDPDNRRPVDFSQRSAKFLAKSTRKGVEFAPNWEDGTVKLAWTRHLLDLRHRHAEVFAFGSYRSLAVEGRHADHVIAFTRRYKEQACSVVVLRYFAAVHARRSELARFSHAGCADWRRANGTRCRSIVGGFPGRGVSASTGG